MTVLTARCVDSYTDLDSYVTILPYLPTAAGLLLWARPGTGRQTDGARLDPAPHIIIIIIKDIYIAHVRKGHKCAMYIHRESKKQDT